MMEGLIIKGIGGFYYVKTGSGLIECRGRGSLKTDGFKLAVGDRVIVSEVELSSEASKRGFQKEGVIEEVLPRKNEFIRPPIVNVELFAVTFAARNPEPSFSFIDKFLVMAEMHNIEALLIMNKADLVSEEEISGIRAVYSPVYPFIALSMKDGRGMEELRQAIFGRTVCFAGPSGVGKSTIINEIIPHAHMETGSISERTLRGRHTTRHAELFETESDGMVFDTPGFTSFDIMEAEEENLQDFYPEIAPYRGKCYYDNCRHIKEPDCAVRNAVREGIISRARYLSYKENILEIRSKKKY